MPHVEGYVVEIRPWRPRWPVYALIVAVFAGLIALLLTKILFPGLLENVSFERPAEFYEQRARDRPYVLMFAAGAAIVFETVRRLLR